MITPRRGIQMYPESCEVVLIFLGGLGTRNIVYDEGLTASKATQDEAFIAVIGIAQYKAASEGSTLFQQQCTSNPESLTT